MVFSSMTFLFAFLPVVVLVYMLSPKQMKNAILLIASLFFYAWGEPRNILLMLLSIGINYRSRQSITVKNACLELGLCSFMECADTWYF